MKDATGTEIKKYDYVCRGMRWGNSGELRFGIVKEVSETSIKVISWKYHPLGGVSYFKPSTWHGFVGVDISLYVLSRESLPQTIIDAAMNCPGGE